MEKSVYGVCVRVVCVFAVLCSFDVSCVCCFVVRVKAMCVLWGVCVMCGYGVFFIHNTHSSL